MAIKTAYIQQVFPVYERFLPLMVTSCGFMMEDSATVYAVYAVLMLIAGTVLYCTSTIMDELLKPKLHPAHL